MRKQKVIARVRISFCYVLVAANRNSGLTTERNDILNNLGSYFLSIGKILGLK
jgi:hypothetical protein